MKTTRLKKLRDKLSFVVVSNCIFNSLLLFFYYDLLFIYLAHYKMITKIILIIMVS